MVRKAEVTERIFMDEAEGFLLSHALFSPPRTWPPLPPEQPTQAERLQRGAKKMDWDGQMAATVGNTAEGPAGSPTRSTAQGQVQRKASGTGQTGVGDWFELESTSVAGPSSSGRRVDGYDEAEDSQERCVICLMALRDRTVVGVCGHEFCFECISVWANQSRRCPLCSADMAPFLLHDLDNTVPTKFYLPPLPTRKLPPLTLTLGRSAAGPSRRVISNQTGDTPEGVDQEEADELGKQVERRKEIYRHGLFVKHIPSNNSTGFGPNPSPRQIADSPALIQRATAFLRRELRIWGLADVEYLVTYVLNLLKAIDLRSEPFIRLLRGILEPENWAAVGGGAHNHAHAQLNRRTQQQQQQYPNAAEHLAHEMYSWLRSPYKELWRWDALAQYDPVPVPSATAPASKPTAPGAEPATDKLSEANLERHDRGRSRSRSRSRSDSRSRSRSRSSSYSSYSSRSDSRSLSPLPPRDPRERDTFIARPRHGERRWDEADTWLDPDWERELETRHQKAEKRREKAEARAKRKAVAWEAKQEAKRARYEQQQGREGGYDGPVPSSSLPIPVAVPIRALHGHGMRAWGEREASGVELLPDGSPAPPPRVEQDSAQPGLAIKGRSSFGQGPDGRKLSLAERLARAKAEQAGTREMPSLATSATPRALTDIPTNLPSNPADITVEDLLASSPNAHGDLATSVPNSSSSTRTDVDDAPQSRSETVLERIARARQRLRLRLKLESERACLRHNIAESKAQTLRTKLLEAKISRQAGETDVQLRRMDKLERDKEVRRRLMVAKMMSAETDGERRARELKEQLARARRGVKGVMNGTVGTEKGEAQEDRVEYDLPILSYAYEPPQVPLAAPRPTVSVPATDAAVKATLEPNEKTAEAKVKEEARRAKILRNLLLERRRAKGASSADPNPASATAPVPTPAAAVGAAASVAKTQAPLLSPTVPATPATPAETDAEAEAAVEQVLGLGVADDDDDDDDWDIEPEAVI